MKVLVLLALIFASSSQATTKVVTGSIDCILTDGRLCGGYMVLAPSIQPLSAYGLNCHNNHFTLDCAGDEARLVVVLKRS